MKCNVTSAIAFENFHAALCELLRRGEHVRSFGIPAEGDHRRVLQQKKNIADAAFFAQVNQLLLQAEGRRVVESAELEDGNQLVKQVILQPGLRIRKKRALM